MHIFKKDNLRFLIANIRKQFGQVLKGEPFRFGSTENGTALKEKYDIDVSVSFRPGSFATIIDMYEILEEYLRKLMGKNGVIQIRKQNVSIGVFFELGFGRE